MKRLFEFLVNLFPSKNYSFALTFHNFSSKDFHWFERTIDLLSEEFQFIDPNNLEDILNNKNSQKKILITFDDGFKSNLYIAEKILKPRGIKAIFFITSSFIGLHGKAAYDFAAKNFYPESLIPQKYIKNIDAMDWKDINWLIRQGNKIGAHTTIHSKLSNLKKEEVYKDITESVNILEEKTGETINYFAYPFGNFDSINKECLEIIEYKFKLAFSNIRGGLHESNNKYLIYRQNLVPETPVWKIKAIANGKIDLLYKYQKLRLMNLK